MMMNAHDSLPHTDPDPVIDRFGRQLRYLRLSVTDVCNLSCQYCNPVKACKEYREKQEWDDLAFLATVAVEELGVEALRITGGEPTVRPGLVDFVARMNALPGLKDIAMTTNAMRLSAMAEPLAKAGLRRVNISLDSLQPELFRTLTRGGSLKKCLAGIRAAQDFFSPVKLNVVMLRGQNMPDELPEFVNFAAKENLEVRFIELMPIFGEKEFFHRHFISVDEAMGHLREAGYRLMPTNGTEGGGYGPASRFMEKKTGAGVGFISQMSDTKCATCNKLRVTSDGALKPCLLSPNEQDLVPLIAKRDREAVAFAMAHQFLVREERYNADDALTNPFNRGMQAIGG